MPDSAIAIIPARGGSKRIPRKNIKDFLGKPVIAYSIQRALESALFDRVVVSTDDQEIAKIAKEHGAEVPFLRSLENSGDHTSTVEVMKEVLQELAKQNESYKYVCCIYPVAPLIETENLKEAFELMKENNLDCVIPVCEFSSPVHRSFKLGQENKIDMMFPEYLQSRTQDMPTAYHDAGQFYWFLNSSFEKTGEIFTDNSAGIVLHQMQVQDIDNESDWLLAEMKFKLKDQAK